MHWLKDWSYFALFPDLILLFLDHDEKWAATDADDIDRFECRFECMYIFAKIS